MAWATALVALAVFCLSPWMIEASRLVEAEWLLAPMLLGVLILASHRGRLPSAALLALCVLAPLVKVPGVIVGGAGAVALLTERRWVMAGLALLGAPVGIGLFAAYGAAVDWHQFVLVWQVQASPTMPTVQNGSVSGTKFHSPASPEKRNSLPAARLV